MPYEFHYSHILRKRDIAISDELRDKTCVRCGDAYRGTRSQKRCEPCREIVRKEQQQKANRKLNQRRQAASQAASALRDSIRGALARVGG